MPVIRTEEQITEAMQRAQQASFTAEDNNDTDEPAEAVYQALLWLLGHSDLDPTLEMAEDL